MKLEAAAESLREHIAEQQLDIVTLGQEVGRLLSGYDQILDHLSDAVQSDCENGVRVLNEIATKNYLKEYPETRAAFHAIGKIGRAALGEEKK